MKRPLANTKVTVKIRRGAIEGTWYLQLESYPVYVPGSATDFGWYERAEQQRIAEEERQKVEEEQRRLQEKQTQEKAHQQEVERKKVKRISPKRTSIEQDRPRRGFHR